MVFGVPVYPDRSSLYRAARHCPEHPKGSEARGGKIHLRQPVMKPDYSMQLPCFCTPLAAR
jgi:hypothetical protein